MLSISRMSSGQEQYYLDLAREDYYLEGGEPEGVWLGKGAAVLGLKGVVQKDELRSLFQGFSPTGEALGQIAGRKHRRPGWDHTFSAPKSVSVLWSQASSELRTDIQRSHFKAVQAAVEYLEDSAAFSRRGHGGLQKERAKVVVAAFEHGTSRAQDPHLHTHTLILNTAYRKDKTWGSLDSRDLYRHKMAAGALYRAELASQLRAIGLSLRRENSWFEVNGVSDSLCEHFSKRRAEIESLLEEHGVSGAVASEAFALTSREVKRHVARGELLEKWSGEGADHKFDMHEVLSPRLGGTPRSLKEGMKRAERIADQLSHFTERDIVRQVAESLQDGGVSANEIRAAVSQAVDSSDIVSLGEDEGYAQYTTAELYSVESELLELAEQSRSDSRHVIDSQSVERVLRSRACSSLSDEQAEAVRHVTGRTGAVQCVSGYAGSGKTRSLEAARKVWEKSGHTVIGCAIAGKAARELETGSGIKSRTLAKTLWLLDNTLLNQIKHNLSMDGLKRHVSLDNLFHPTRRAIRNKPLFDKQLKPIRRGMTLTPKTVVVVDEASMVGTRALARLVRHIERAGAKLVLVGDSAQLQSIEAGSPFHTLFARLGGFQLKDIRRQALVWMNEAVRKFAEGDVRSALSDFAVEGKLKVSPTRPLAIEQLIQDWAGSRHHGINDTLILTGTRDDTEQLNTLAQAHRLKEGELGKRSLSVGESRFHEGDRVLITKNSAVYDISNGDLATVIKVHPRKHLRERGSLTLLVDDGRTGGRQVTVAIGDYDHLQLGYAVTTHKGQGASALATYVLAGGWMNDRELAYVQMSRGIEDTMVYVSEVEAGEDLAELGRQMSRSRMKLLAHDVEHQQLKQLERLGVEYQIR